MVFLIVPSHVPIAQNGLEGSEIPSERELVWGEVWGEWAASPQTKP